MADVDLSGRDPATGQFLPGNRFWEARSSAGANPKFETPEQLWAACLEYFDWNATNPLYEAKLVTFQGDAKLVPSPKMRAMSIGAMCIFLDITQQTWRDWRSGRPDLFVVMTRAEEIIRSQKFEGASADLLNPNIIARDLGLADKREFEGELKVKDERTPEEVADAIAGKLAGITAAKHEG